MTVYQVLKYLESHMIGLYSYRKKVPLFSVMNFQWRLTKENKLKQCFLTKLYDCLNLAWCTAGDLSIYLGYFEMFSMKLGSNNLNRPATMFPLVVR